MIALVLVCHSALLAEGVAELASQMADGGLRIGVAGGLDQPGKPLGTDAALVARVIEEVWSEDGVLVLMDLGSAVLSAEMALELLPEERRDRVLLSEAPFVEGAVAAAVAAGLGDSLQTVAAEARRALVGKSGQLVPAPAVLGAPPAADHPPAEAEAGAGAGAEGPSLRLTVENPLGLHARPAAALVRTAAAFDAEVRIGDLTTGRGPVNARSLSAVSTLGVRRGDEIVVRASGPQAEEALAAVRRLAGQGWGDPPEAGPEAPLPGSAAGAGHETPVPTTEADDVSEDRVAAAPAPGSVLRGFPASPGIAVGPARRLRAASPQVSHDPTRDREADRAALQQALSAAAESIREARRSVAARAGDYDAAIFDAHLLLLEDEALLDPAFAGIRQQGKNAAHAWADAVAAAAAAWDAVDDPYLRGRATDLCSVGDQVLRQILGEVLDEAEGAAADEAGGGEGAPAAIVVVAELSPAETASLDPARVLGIACAFGGPTSHSAILARSLGIPAVVGAGRDLLAVAPGTTLALDGEAGTVAVDPSAAVLEAAGTRRTRLAEDAAAAFADAHLPAVTRDGATVHVAANVAAPADIAAAVAAGADGVGLLRTEFLFLQADRLPGEDEQEMVYRQAAQTLGGRPLTIRTLDVGADKPLPYLRRDWEANPCLGLRGLRLGLDQPDLLATQLRAVLRVAADYPVRLMFPMVASVDEVLRARELLEAARASLGEAGAAREGGLEVGIMVEVPSAALLAEAFVPHVDFFSLGTNDLTQYVLAADRGNAAVAGLADALHPAVLRLIERTARAATEGGRNVAVCGEVAGDPLAIPILLGLGVSELSMAPARIPAAKRAVRGLDLTAARRLAARALEAESAGEVRRLAGEDA